MTKKKKKKMDVGFQSLKDTLKASNDFKNKQKSV